MWFTPSLAARLPLRLQESLGVVAMADSAAGARTGLSVRAGHHNRAADTRGGMVAAAGGVGPGIASQDEFEEPGGLHLTELYWTRHQNVGSEPLRARFGRI